MTRALAALLLLGTASCAPGERDERGETLRVDVVGSFDPRASRTLLSGPRAVLNDSTQLGLVDLDAAGQVVPGLATSWRVSDDGLGVIFRLRPLEWPDGRKVLARDAVTTFRRIAAPSSQHPLKAMLDRIVNAPAIGAGAKSQSSLGITDPLPNIVEVRLSTPQPALLQLLGDQSTAVLRKGDFPPPLGAFTIINAVSRPLHLARNPRYFDAASVQLAGVDLLPVEDPVAAITRFRRNETDIVIGDGIAGLGEARTVSSQTALRIDPAYGVYGYLANTRRGPLADKRVRRALAMIVDRATLVQRMFAIPAMQPVTGLVPPNLPGHLNPARPDWDDWLYIQRLTEARRLLSEAGYRPDRPLSVEVIITSGREHRRVLDVVARDWEAVGVSIKPVVRSEQGLADDIATGRFTLALTERRAPVDSARFFLAPFGCRPQSPYCNRSADALLRNRRTETNSADRTVALRRAEQAMVDDQPMIPLFIPVRWALVRSDIAGWSSNVLGAHPLSRLNKTSATKGK